jgi:RimJ/RimL family protein N-acetyltransferase
MSVTRKSEPLPSTGQPVGLPLADPSPAKRPAPVTLAGRFGSVERLDAARHGPTLWQAIRGHDGLWTYNPFGPFPEEAVFSTWLAEREKVTDPYYYVSVDKAGRAIGMATLMEIRPNHRVIEVGHVCYSPSLQRTPLATETIYLLARYIFEDLGYRRFEWKCNEFNAPSKRAAERFGFAYEGLFRQHMIVKGRNRDTAWYSMLDGEWPERKAAFEKWLAPDNFDKDGRQKTSLAALNGVKV